jgi:hypothetical protein
MRRINCIFAPAYSISDTVQGYRAITFPTIETDDEHLVHINNIEIANRIGMNDDFMREVNDNDIDKPFGKPIETMHAPSFMTALAWFNKLTQ